MEQWETFIRKLLEHTGFSDFRVEVDPEHNHGSIFIYDHPAFLKEHTPALVENINHIVQLVARKQGSAPVFFDINNYRRERENLIGELARTAARKVAVTKSPIQLPAMNSYERRLVHVELAAHPGVATESVGAGRERSVIIKPLLEGSGPARPSEEPAVANGVTGS
jgi:predicted RNA-binding protein Jag